MKKVRRISEATAPDGTVLALCEHDGEYVIRINGIELMSTRRHHSEDTLADLVCAPLQGRSGARVLIGGLGLGFTLKAALRLLAPDARVVVAEIVPAVVDWNRNPDHGLAAQALQDARVEVRLGDVARVLAAQPGGFDAILLDVDNGAAPLTTAGNAQLYRAAGISLAAAALRPHGRLAYWSAQPDRAFAAALGQAGLAVTVTQVRAHATTGPRHTLFVGQRGP